MIDNVTFESAFNPPDELLNAGRLPFYYKDVIYRPKYNKVGDLISYEGFLKNLRLCMYPDKIYLENSLHKYWHGGNYCDYTLPELKSTIAALSDKTGVNWHKARTSFLEFGGNLAADASKIIDSLVSYNKNEYSPMKCKKKGYGKISEAWDYDVKVYDKTFEAKRTSKISLRSSILRVEIVWKRVRAIENWLEQPLLVENLLMPETLDFLAQDLVKKYASSIRKEMLNPSGLPLHHKRIMAEMLVPQIREDFMRNHNATYKRDSQTFNEIMADKRNLIVDDTIAALPQKLEELIHGQCRGIVSIPSL